MELEAEKSQLKTDKPRSGILRTELEERTFAWVTKLGRAASHSLLRCEGESASIIYLVHTSSRRHT